MLEYTTAYRSRASLRCETGLRPTGERELTSNNQNRLLCRAYPKGALMRIPALAILTIATVAAPAWAQTYDPSYPVCLQSYGIDGDNIECGYTSLAQCNATASGRAAQCIINPYFASARVPPGRQSQRHRRVY
jgi:hypothetical protein